MDCAKKCTDNTAGLQELCLLTTVTMNTEQVVFVACVLLKALHFACASTCSATKTIVTNEEYRSRASEYDVLWNESIAFSEYLVKYIFVLLSTTRTVLYL